MARVLINGILGQDGTHLARLVAAQGDHAIGLVRPGRACGSDELRMLPDGVSLLEWDMDDADALAALLRDVGPAELYNLASFSTGVGMFDDPLAMANVNGMAVTRMLEAIRSVDPEIRFCQASSSEMFGEPVESPQNEATPFNPRSPYGAAKLYAHNMIGIYRARFGLFACSAILFNHESPQRTTDFVTRKVTRAAAAISLGQASEVSIGNLDARRDWSFAGDVVAAMRLMLRAAEPDDYVVASGETHSVRDLCDVAFSHVGLDYRDYVRVNAPDFRPEEPRQLVGDASKARRKLGWGPTIGFAQLIQMMVQADLDRLRADTANSGA
jgi:GDPmannose 4,6-dehydratase